MPDLCDRLRLDLRVNAMLVVEVNVVGVQASQRAPDGGVDGLGAAVGHDGGAMEGEHPPLRRPRSVWLLALNEDLVDLVGIELLGDAGEDDR